MRGKYKQIIQAKRDFLKDYNIAITPFTKKDFFYFHILDGIKYIHKESLRLVYSNNDTYSYDSPSHPNTGGSFSKEEAIKTFERVLDMLRDFDGSIETEHFIGLPVIPGEPIISVTADDFFRIKESLKDMTLTPFYNSMCYNMVREGEKITLIDYKHYEEKDDKPFFIYMNNLDHNINTLYIEPHEDIELMMEHLQRDYKVTEKNIKYMEKK